MGKEIKRHTSVFRSTYRTFLLPVGYEGGSGGGTNPLQLKLLLGHFNRAEEKTAETPETCHSGRQSGQSRLLILFPASGKCADTHTRGFITALARQGLPPEYSQSEIMLKSVESKYSIKSNYQKKYPSRTKWAAITLLAAQ